MIPKVKPFAQWTEEEKRAFDEAEKKLDAEMAASEERAEREGRPLNDIIFEDCGRNRGWSEDEIARRLAQWKIDCAAVQVALAGMREISTCPQCRALFPVGEACPGCGADSQAAPGQPFPDDSDPEEPKNK